MNTWLITSFVTSYHKSFHQPHPVVASSVKLYEVVPVHSSKTRLITSIAFIVEFLLFPPL